MFKAFLTAGLVLASAVPAFADRGQRYGGGGFRGGSSFGLSLGFGGGYAGSSVGIGLGFGRSFGRGGYYGGGYYGGGGYRYAPAYYPPVVVERPVYVAPPPVYYEPPAAYYAPPVYAAPAPVYVGPPAVYAPPPAATRRRRFTTTTATAGPVITADASFTALARSWHAPRRPRRGGGGVPPDPASHGPAFSGVRPFRLNFDGPGRAGCWSSSPRP